MASLLAINSYFSPSPSLLINPKYTSQTSHRQLQLPFSPLFTSSSTSPLIHNFPNFNSRLLSSKSKATLDQELLQQQQQEEPNNKVEVEESVKVLKNAAKTRKVKAEEVLAALSVISKAKLDPSEFLQTLGGTESPGNTWMLIFTSQDKLTRGSYFPITAIQRFDAAAKRIENGVYLGPVGSLTFEGKFSWKKRILAFVFEYLRIKVGPFGPLQISLGQSQDREPNTKDPFFIWFYIDEEIAVAQGRGGGTAFWCRCRRLT